MKAFIALALMLSVAQTALAQSRGNAGIGSMRSGKASVASGKDLERAQRYADQARKRLGGGSARKGNGGWAAGGSSSSWR